jgi:hypothetical protein
VILEVVTIPRISRDFVPAHSFVQPSGDVVQKEHLHLQAAGSGEYPSPGPQSAVRNAITGIAPIQFCRARPCQPRAGIPPGHRRVPHATELAPDLVQDHDSI